MRALPALAAVVAVLVAFVAGRLTAPSSTHAHDDGAGHAHGDRGATSSTPSSSSSSSSSAAATPKQPTVVAGTDTHAGHDAHDAPDRAPPTAPKPIAPKRPPPPPGERCEVTLERVEAELDTMLARKQELEGAPLPQRDDVPPRFASGGLVSTFQGGFAASGVKGTIESTDCTEHPCIIFGRIEGDEGEVAKLEDSASFAAYDKDVGVMLTWASGHHGDEAHEPSGTAARQKPPEVSLFAFAYYATDDPAGSEAIDRRIRTRTAEYWNASRPHDH